MGGEWYSDSVGVNEDEGENAVECWTSETQIEIRWGDLGFGGAIFFFSVL